MIDPSSSEPITLDGSCHCGAVKFSASCRKGFASARRCTCSICRMRGAVAVTSDASSGSSCTRASDKLATYRFNTGVAEHHFCTVCGIYTHHKRRSNPTSWASTSPASRASPRSIFRRSSYTTAIGTPATIPITRTYRAGVLRFEPASDA